MSWIEKVKENINEESAISKVVGKWLEKGEEMGAKGMENTREMMASMSDNASNIASITRLKYELLYDRKSLNEAHTRLGEICVTQITEGSFSESHADYAAQIQKMDQLHDEIQAKTNDYLALKRLYADTDPVSQFAEDLSSANAVMERVVISETSNVVSKLLKEILLPKEVLISGVTRDDALIIPDGNTRLKAGDQVMVIGAKDAVEKLVKRFSG